MRQINTYSDDLVGFFLICSTFFIYLPCAKSWGKGPSLAGDTARRHQVTSFVSFYVSNYTVDLFFFFLGCNCREKYSRSGVFSHRTADKSDIFPFEFLEQCELV